MECAPKTGTIVLSQESQDIITTTLGREKKIDNFNERFKKFVVREKVLRLFFTSFIPSDPNHFIKLQHQNYPREISTIECGFVIFLMIGVKMTFFFLLPQSIYEEIYDQISKTIDLGLCRLRIS